ncbi:MAG: TOBE domain-containing protein, partial [Erysipelotrichaceae bacterium]|nr:TOBE domain-containing protein [Erysipelotrichaceae bacterium]
EHIVLADKKGENSIACTIQVNEMMGSELHLHVLTEDGTPIIVRVPTVNLTHEQREQMVNGHKIFITFEGKVMHFFDPETTENLL